LQDKDSLGMEDIAFDEALVDEAGENGLDV
jgi:hypothetical protein